MKRSKHITLDDLPPKYREQAERQLYTVEETVPYEFVERVSNKFRAYRESIHQPVNSSPIVIPLKGTPAPARTRERKPSGPNKTEQLFNREMLGGLGQYEAVTLKLPGGSRYTGDWLLSVFDPQEQRFETTIYEVKGSYKLGSHGRALTAFREARAAFPFLTFKWYEKQKGGGWIERYKG